jgi:protease-4
MLAFVRTFFAALFALVAFFTIPVVLLLAVAVLGEAGPKDHSWLTIRLSGSLLEYYGPPSLEEIFGDRPTCLMEITENLEKAAVDDRIEGVLFRLEGVAVGPGKLDEIRAGIRSVREAGKPVYAYGTWLGDAEVYLGSECDSLFLFPKGRAYLTGRGVTIEHVKKTLDLLDIVPWLHTVGDYKSLSELFTVEHSSPETLENVEWFVGDIAARTDSVLAANLGRTVPDIEAARSRVVLDAHEAVERGLADELLWWDELVERLKGPRDDWRTVSSPDYAEIERSSVGLSGRAKIAVVHAQGFVGSGGDDGWDPVLGLMMGVDRVVDDLEEASDDDHVDAIVLRWDTGGGATDGGERIARAVKQARERKPVVVSVADVAASAGYTMSYAANVIVCPANGVTGSIGSVFGKLDTRGFWRKLGVTFDDVRFSPNAWLFSDVHGFTDEQWTRIAEDHQASYEEWIADIAEARGVTPEEIDAVGGGRVWSGAQGLEHRLVDRLGGFDVALAAARELAELEPGAAVEIEHLPRPKSPIELLLEGDLGPAAATHLLRAARDSFLARRAERPAEWAREPLRVR